MAASTLTGVVTVAHAQYPYSRPHVWPVPQIIADEPGRSAAERRRERFRQLRETPSTLPSGALATDGNPWRPIGPTYATPRPAATPDAEVHPRLAETGRIRPEFERSGTPLRPLE